MNTRAMPQRGEMLEAFFSRDGSYDGVFFTGVRTTGIFCRPTCPAKKPLERNVDFFASIQAALFAGFRPCKRCRPMEPTGSLPTWLGELLSDFDAEPAKRWTDQDLRDRGLSPERVRRWFQSHHGMTFHAYGRARRLGLALGQIKHGSGVSRAAYRTGYESLSGFNDAFKRFLGEAPTALVSAKVVMITRIATPLGPMVAGAVDDTLCLLEFADRRMIETQIARLQKRLDCVFVPGTSALFTALAGELESYFAGGLIEFSVPLLTPGTDFQRSVWSQLRTIPSGATRSYAEVAIEIGRPTAVRAVARANGDNRIAILVPCHRVVGSDGKLTGYGGGLWRKQRLLEIEQTASGQGSGSG
jgi:AraC family transcriptional regulator of adaptative response/methylated-DNA-[protein]-cysteine methyltransferase